MTLKSRNFFSAVHVFSIVLSLVSSPLAQMPRNLLGIHQMTVQEPLRTEEEKKAAEELEKKALALIDVLVAEAMSLRLAENRVYFLTVMSDGLWARDEGRARALVRQAMDQVVAYLRELKEKATEEDWERFDLYYYQMISSRLANRDARLTLAFLQQTRPLWPKERKRQQKNLELTMASQLAERDPESALRIAEEYLNSKLDNQVIYFWSELLRKDSKAASLLTRRIIANLKSQDILADSNSSDVLYRAAEFLRVYVNGIAKERNNPDVTNATRFGSAEIKNAYLDVLEVIVTAALKVAPAQLWGHLQEMKRAGNPTTLNLRTLVKAFLPDIEKHLPSRAPAVRSKLAQFDEALKSLPAPQPFSFTDFGNTVKDLDDTLKNKSPDEVIAMAAEIPVELKYALYIEAAGKLIEQGDTARARQILKDFLPDNEYLEAMKPFIAMMEVKTRERAWEEAIKEGKLGEARTQLEARLSLALDSLSLDPNRGFDILGSAIDSLNTLSIEMTSMNKYDQRGAPFLFPSIAGNNEMTLSDFSSINLATELIERLFYFARKDINRTMALLNGLQVTEVRLAIFMELLNRILRA
jgi:hypothetical protein